METKAKMAEYPPVMAKRWNQTALSEAKPHIAPAKAPAGARPGRVFASEARKYGKAIGRGVR